MVNRVMFVVVSSSASRYGLQVPQSQDDDGGGGTEI